MTVFLIVLFAFILFIAIWDVYLILKHGKQASISANLILYSKKYPSIPVLFGLIIGFVFGHLFWSMSDFDWMPKEEMIVKCEKFIEENKQ